MVDPDHPRHTPPPGPGAHWPVVVDHELPSQMSSVPIARDFVRSALHGYQEGMVEDAQLLVSELVTNAVRGNAGPVRLRISVGDGRAAVTVTDRSPGVPRLGKPSWDSNGGRGLLLVDAVAASWGWDEASPGTRVWFEL